MLQSYVRGHPARPRGGRAGRRRRPAHDPPHRRSRRCSRPGIVVTALFAFVTAWNEFFFALVLLDSPSLTTLPLRLAQFVGIEGIVRLGPLAASALLATLPSLVIFAVIQRWLTRGLISGAVKG